MPSCTEPLQRVSSGRDIQVELVDGMAAQAAASVDGVQHQARARCSRGATCSQIEFHEGHVHVATALNGRAQPVMPFMGYPSPAPPARRRGWRC